MELYIAEEYIEFTRIKHLSDGSVIREDMRREVADELASEVLKAKAEALREAAEALETVTVHWSNDGEDTRAAWLRRRANRLEEGP